MPERIPMTARQRAELLVLPDTEPAVIHHYGLDAEDFAVVAAARTPATRLGDALQLCALRYPDGICVEANCYPHPCSTISSNKSGSTPM